MMETVNVYDFDKTILPYDSTERFFAYCLRRWPRVAGPALRAVPMLPGMKLKLTTKTHVKEVFYRFLTCVPDIDAAVEDFWRQNFGNINAWYLAQMRPDDIISSASPDFLLRPVTNRLGVRLIASRVDKLSGWTLGENNQHEEKVRRFRREYPNTEVNEFYSDSLSDTPMAKLARAAFIVNGSEIRPWPWDET